MTQATEITNALIQTYVLQSQLCWTPQISRRFHTDLSRKGLMHKTDAQVFNVRSKRQVICSVWISQPEELNQIILVLSTNFISDQSISSRKTSGYDLMTSGDRQSKTAFAHLFQWLITLTVKSLCLVSKLNFLWLQLPAAASCYAFLS